MKRSRNVWFVFAAALAVMLGAMGLLSRYAVGLEAEQRSHRAQAEREERIRLALWRMDAAVTGFVAAEAARPYYQFETFYVSPPPALPPRIVASGLPVSDGLRASELLTGGSPLVRLYFRMGRDGAVHSPQAPQPPVRSLAVERFISEDQAARADRLLEELAGSIDPAGLLAALPEPEPPAPAGSVVLTNRNVAAQADPRARGGEEFNVRQAVISNSAIVQTQLGPQAEQEGVHNGPVRAVWSGDELLLARRVAMAGRSEVVGCWLDWPAVQAWLLANVSDLLPEAELAAAPAGAPNRNVSRLGSPAEGSDPARLLAALPVRLAPGEVAVSGSAGSAMALGMGSAWAGVLLAAAAVGLLLRRTLALAERRAAFVSAVTHELRTPLTTFSLYAEMLADGTVSEPDKQRRYHRTLHAESQRLGRLVENVLTYSRLERGGHGLECTKVDLCELVAGLAGRLRARAEAAGMELDIRQPAGPGCRASADPAAVERILDNLVDNACKYGSAGPQRRIEIAVEDGPGGPAVRVSDHGPGVRPADRRIIFRPFARGRGPQAAPSGGIGLGLAISRRLARAMGGDLRLVTAGRPAAGSADGPAGATFLLLLPRWPDSNPPLRI